MTLARGRREVVIMAYGCEFGWCLVDKREGGSGGESTRCAHVSKLAENDCDQIVNA